MSSSFGENLHERLAYAGARLLRAPLLMRAPICMYRARLGFVFGSRLLLLEHTAVAPAPADSSCWRSSAIRRLTPTWWHRDSDRDRSGIAT